MSATPAAEPEVPTGTAASAGVYRAQDGRIWRVIQALDGGISVQILRDGEWLPGPIGLVGLRLNDSTVRLSPEAIGELPE